MDFETVGRHGRIYVSINGVETMEFVIQGAGGCVIYAPRPVQTTETMDEALRIMAADLGAWYTATEAAAQLAEMGVFDKAPWAHEVCLWARNGLLPGAVKITGKGGWGRGGSWRIPQSALDAFAERRRER